MSINVQGFNVLLWFGTLSITLTPSIKLVYSIFFKFCNVMKKDLFVKHMHVWHCTMIFWNYFQVLWGVVYRNFPYFLFMT